MGDIPFGVSYYSADVFAHPEQLRARLVRRRAAGAVFQGRRVHPKVGTELGHPALSLGRDAQPATSTGGGSASAACGKFFTSSASITCSAFTASTLSPGGRRRNREFLPLDWDEMRARTGGREPHFSPRDDRSWENCEANRREGEEYLRVVLEESGETRVVGEDLGTVPDYVRPSLRSLGIAGFKIPQWENYPDQRSIPGSAYERLSVATYATHDHKPLRALWEEAFEKPTNSASRRATTWRRSRSLPGSLPPNESIDYLNAISIRRFSTALFRSESWIAHRHDHRSARAQGSVQCSGHRGQLQLDPAPARPRSRKLGRGRGS